MAKSTPRGLPEGFDIDIPEPTKAVQLGDYMEEIAVVTPKRTPLEPPPAPPGAKASNVVEIPVRPAEAKSTKARTPRASKKTKPPRKQINATPQTLEMVEELVEKVREETGQRDAKASEVFGALVMALHEAKELVNLQDIEARGRWGTPTAQSFVVNLKGAFQAAIAEHHRPKRK